MMKIQIRKAKNKDIKHIISIIENHYKIYNDSINLNLFDKDLIDLEKSYFEKKGYFWVATINNVICGTIAIIPTTVFSCEIKRVYVIEKHHRKKIGKRLLQKTFDYAVENNFKKVFLLSDIRYKKAHKFFMKNKFEIINKEIYFDKKKQYKAILFEKNIT